MKKQKKIMKNNPDASDKYNEADTMQELIKLFMNSTYGKSITGKNNKQLIMKSGTEDELNGYHYNYFNTVINRVEFGEREDKYGEIIICGEHIEIYDNYRE